MRPLLKRIDWGLLWCYGAVVFLLIIMWMGLVEFGRWIVNLVVRR